jgi:hypothetical protein
MMASLRNYRGVDEITAFRIKRQVEVASKVASPGYVDAATSVNFVAIGCHA